MRAIAVGALGLALVGCADRVPYGSPLDPSIIALNEQVMTKEFHDAKTTLSLGNLEESQYEVKYFHDIWCLDPKKDHPMQIHEACELSAVLNSDFDKLNVRRTADMKALGFTDDQIDRSFHGIFHVGDPIKMVFYYSGGQSHRYYDDGTSTKELIQLNDNTILYIWDGVITGISSGS